MIELRDLPTEGGRESVPVSRTLLNHPVSYAGQNPEFRFLPLRWTAKAIDYSLKRWPSLTRFLADGRLCISNNGAERALRGISVGRHNWTFAGSDQGGERAAAIYTLIETAKLNNVNPQAWLADVLARLPDHPARRIGELLPWQWCGSRRQAA
jgi:transposase